MRRAWSGSSALSYEWDMVDFAELWRSLAGNPAAAWGLACGLPLALLIIGWALRIRRRRTRQLAEPLARALDGR